MPVADATDRLYAQSLDEADPLREFRLRFLPFPGPDADQLIYLDGNSLGRPPTSALDAITELVATAWAAGVGSWGDWIELPSVVGDVLGAELLGAAAGQVLISDSTTVNLYKLAAAALDARPDRRTIITEAANFPTDRYVLEGLAAARGLRLDYVDVDVLAGASASDLDLGPDVALVCLSHVDYRSAAIADLAGITRAAHEVGALVLWDLCHSVGSIPIALDAAGVDLAAGCTYKYLDGGPGAPAFLYVARELQDSLRQPIWGWFGQRDQFAMGATYDPQPSIDRFATGTPNIVGIRLVEAGVRLLAEAGVDRLRAKGIALTTYLIDLFDSWLAPLGFELASPRDSASRGSHISLRHPAAYQLCRALIDNLVVPDYREPDLIRLGVSALTTSFADVHEAMRRLHSLTVAGAYLDIETVKSRVT
ncbi:MAG TPA: kynureninase [Acidothermaceae bacterium]